MKPYYDKDGIQIYCGDCRDILPTLEPVDLLLSDPPYGINYVHGSETHSHASKFNNIPVIGDNEPFDPSPFLKYPKVILWGANHYADKLPASPGWLIWDKRCQTVVNDQSDCELAWTSFLTTARIHYLVWDGFRKGGGEMGIPRVHPTQKPIALMKWCIELSKSSGTICDPYMGSGTTLRAAKDLSRRAIGIELEEKYCEIAVKRLAQEVMSL